MIIWNLIFTVLSLNIFSKIFNPNIKYFLAPPNEYDINDVIKDKKKNTSNMKFNCKTTYRFFC